MPYVIGPGCVDELAGDCVDACPVDCIYEGARNRYVNPHECIECGACLPLPRRRRPGMGAGQQAVLRLPGRPEPIGSPRAAGGFGPAGTDTELTAAITAASQEE